MQQVKHPQEQLPRLHGAMAGEEGKTHPGEDRERTEIKHGGRYFYSLDKREKQRDNETQRRDSPDILARVPLAL